jgi:nucleoid DNA-binding protein
MPDNFFGDNEHRRVYARTAVEEIIAQSGMEPTEARDAFRAVVSWIRWKIANEQEVDMGTFSLVPREDGPRSIRFNLKKRASGSDQHFLIGAKTRWVFKPRKLRGS